MANGVQTQIKPEVIAIAGLLAVGGIALVIIGMGQQGGPSGGEHFSSLTSASLLSRQTVPIVFQNPTASAGVAATNPMFTYQGPGRNVFGYFRIEQTQNGITATVYGSGIAGQHLPNTPTPTQYKVVPADPTTGQGFIQPTGCPNAGSRTFDLCAKSYPGGVATEGVTDICGFWPVPGVADAILELYGDTMPQDGGGYAPPTCVAPGQPGRVPLLRQRFPGAILFQ